MDKLDLLQLFQGYYDGQAQLNHILPRGFDISQCTDQIHHFNKSSSDAFHLQAKNLALAYQNQDYSLASKYFTVIDSLIKEVFDDSYCKNLNKYLSYTSGSNLDVELPYMNDTDNDGIADEWTFTSKNGYKMNVLPTLDLISMHLHNWKEMQATENEEAAELQYRIGYLSGMFNTLVI